MAVGKKCFSISYRKSLSKFQLNPHYEHVYQLVYIYRGIVRYFIGDQIYEDVQPGEIILLNTLEMHSLEVLKYPYERYLLQIDPTFFQQEVKYPEVLSFFVKKPGNFNHRLILSEETGLYVYQCMIEMERENTRREAYWEMAVGSNLRRLFIRLFRDCKDQFPNESVKASTVIGYRVMQYLDQHFEEEIRVKKVAEKFFLSEHYVAHAFHKATGYGLIDYVIMLRMNRARALLIETDLQISEVAVRCGYTDFTYFTKLFKKNTGMTPTAFRKRAEQNTTIKHL